MREITIRAFFPEGYWFHSGMMYEYEETYGIEYFGLKYDGIEFVQYIGKCDSSDRKIYDGDIVTDIIYPFYDDGDPNYVGIVKYDNKDCCYYVELKCVNPTKSGISNGISKEFCDFCEIEVVGNIYENPELLELRR